MGVFKFSAKVGEIIKGKLARGEGGRFINAAELQAKQNQLSSLILQFIKDGALVTSGKLTPGKQKKAKANAKPKPKKTSKPSSKRKAKKETERKQKKPSEQENIAKVQASLNLPGLDSLIAYRDGNSVDASQLKDFVNRGLLEMDLDGNFRMTTEGTRLVRAAKRGDTRIAADMISRGQERVEKNRARKADKQDLINNHNDNIADAERQKKPVQNELNKINEELAFLPQSMEIDPNRLDIGVALAEQAQAIKRRSTLERKQRQLSERLDNLNDTQRRAQTRVRDLVDDINELDTKLGLFTRLDTFFKELDTKDIKFFRQDLRDNLKSYFFNTFTRSQFIARMSNIVIREFEQAWLRGMSECGQDITSIDDLTPVERDALLEKTQEQFPFIENLADEITTDISLEAWYARLDLWTRRFDEIAIRAKLMACPDDLFEWTLGPTEHCESCLALEGYVMTAQEWLDSGVLPQVANATYLLCQGFNCRCMLSKTTKPKSDRPLPVRSPKLELA